MKLAVFYRFVLVTTVFIGFFVISLSFTMSPKVSASGVLTDRLISQALLDSEPELANFVIRTKLAFQEADKEEIDMLFYKNGIDTDEELVIARKTKEILESPYLNRIGENIERVDDYNADTLVDFSHIKQADIDAGSVPQPLNMIPLYILEIVLEEVSEDSTISYQQVIGRTSSGELKFASYVPLSVCGDPIYRASGECVFY